MGLKHIKIASETVEAPGGSFAVRGLTFDDLQFLVTEHSATMAEMYVEFIGQGEAPESMIEVAKTLLSRAPGIACDIVACAANDDVSELDEDRTVARGLPFPVQLDALEKALLLTFNVTGGPKKVLEIVIRLAQGTTGLLSDLQT